MLSSFCIGSRMKIRRIIEVKMMKNFHVQTFGIQMRTAFMISPCYIQMKTIQFADIQRIHTTYSEPKLWQKLTVANKYWKMPHKFFPTTSTSSSNRFIFDYWKITCSSNNHQLCKDCQRRNIEANEIVYVDFSALWIYVKSLKILLKRIESTQKVERKIKKIKIVKFLWK